MKGTPSNQQAAGSNPAHSLTYSRTSLKHGYTFPPVPSMFPSQLDHSHQHVHILLFIIQFLKHPFLTPLPLYFSVPCHRNNPQNCCLDSLFPILLILFLIFYHVIFHYYKIYASYETLKNDHRWTFYSTWKLEHHQLHCINLCVPSLCYHSALSPPNGEEATSLNVVCIILFYCVNFYHTYLYS